MGNRAVTEGTTSVVVNVTRPEEPSSLLARRILLVGQTSLTPAAADEEEVHLRLPSLRTTRHGAACQHGSDLLGRVILVRRWGRIGTAGKIRLGEHAGEGEALALAALTTVQQRKGYRAIT